MGKSGRSCFDIIACGRGSVASDDDLELRESRASSDKRRWSFRKRSAHHRVLSNTVISEPLSVTGINKEIPEASRNTSSPQDIPFALEKIPSSKKADDALQQCPGTVDMEVTYTSLATEVTDTSLATKDTIKLDPGVQESAAAVIQAAIRGYLVRTELQKVKSVVKLQAAIRGHLVRRQAAGTLRCVQAIVKMQALVRARIVLQSVEKSLDKESSATKQKKSYSWTEKLLTNGFARQLLESTPKTKPIHIDCDPSKSHSAWKWLERWMALPSSDVGREEEINPKPAQEQGRSTKLSSFEVADEVPAAIHTVSADKKSPPVLAVQTEDLISNSAHDFEFQAPEPILVECLSPQDKGDQEHHQPKNDVLSVTQENYVKNDIIQETFGSNSNVVGISASISQSSDVVSDKPEEKLDHFTERASCESLVTEDKKSVFGTRKVCNSAFAAAQAKFEELTSAGSLRSKSSNQDASVVSRSENLPSDSFTEGHVSITEESVSHDPIVQTATSECGTEISISSTLDSPDGFEREGGEIVLEIGALERRDCDENGGSNNASDDSNSDTKNLRAIEILQPSKPDIMNENSTNLIVALDPLQMDQKPSLEHLEKSISSNVNIHQENVIDQEASRSTPEGSPRSPITAPESHGTPSSQISVNSKKSKVEHNMHMRKKRSQVAGGKKSPSKLDTNSGGSSTEHLHKDTKHVKRRSSFGMAIPDSVEHEPRASTSSSLPNYMQATESARAKVANNSPKSSPDTHKDSYARKQHSLPLGNGKQGSSSRMQQSSPQMQPNAKENGTHSAHNSAERRWQR